MACWFREGDIEQFEPSNRYIAGAALIERWSKRPDVNAVAFIKANGAEKAAQEFTNGSAFKDRDLYIAYTDLSGTVLGHGGNPKLVGKNLTGLKDPDGKLFFQMLVDLAKTKGKGWSDSYKFLNPVSKKIEDKVMYVERVDDNWIGVGIYKK